MHDSRVQTFLSTLRTKFVVSQRWNNGWLASPRNKNGTTDYIVLSCSSYRSNQFPPDFSEITYWNIGTSFRADPVPSMYKVAQETSFFFFFFLFVAPLYFYRDHSTFLLLFMTNSFPAIGESLRKRFFDGKQFRSCVDYLPTNRGYMGSTAAWKYLIIDVQ